MIFLKNIITVDVKTILLIEYFFFFLYLNLNLNNNMFITDNGY